MPIDTDSYDQIVERTRADIANELPDVDPTISGSFINALAVANAGRHYDNTLLIQQLIKELFPQTASGEFLEMWAQYEGLSRLPATPSNGFITVTGTAGTTVPALTQWRTVNDVLMASLSGASLAVNSSTVTSLTRIGSTVTGTTLSNHNFATGMQLTISGANETDYNGTFEITVLSETQFSYEITGIPSTPATGTINAEFTGAVIEVEAIEPGVSGNLESGAEVSVTAPIIGMDNTGFVGYLGLTGGAEEESDSSLLERVLYSRANPVANFNVSSIRLACLAVPGVTRVWVNRITPYVGAVTVAFMRDNDPDPIPDAGEIQDVRDVLLDILPAQSDPNDLFVLAPTPVEVDFTFLAIIPDTPTMRSAIINNLTAYFIDDVQYEQDLDEDKYRAIIINTYDTDTGESLESFSLSVPPAGDISISTNEIGVLGMVEFP